MFSDVDRGPDPDGAVAYLESAAASLAAIKQDLVRRLAVARGQRVLDIGCGAGHDLTLLSASGAEAVGVDSSVRMAGESRGRCPAVGVAVADGAALPFISGSFDACRIERVLQHVDDPLAVLNEAARVLRGKCRIVVFEPDWGSFAIDSNRAATQAAITNAIAIGVRNPRAGLQLRGLLVDAGFVVEELVVDVGRYTSIEDIQRFIDLRGVCSRAVMSGILTRSEVTTWNEEMIQRSARGAFQGTFNRMIAVARRPS